MRPSCARLAANNRREPVPRAASCRSVSLVTGVAHGGDAEGDTFSSIESFLGSAQSDTLEGDGGNNVLNGGAGIDTLSYEHASAAITISLATSSAQATRPAVCQFPRHASKC